MKKIYSHSKRTVLAKCPLQYFFEYYAPHVVPSRPESQRGLFAKENPEREVVDGATIAAAGRLKALSNAHLWAGNVLHGLIAYSLKSRNRNLDWFLRTAQDRFDQAALHSRAPAEHAAMRNEPNAPPMFLESYYDDPAAEETARIVRERLVEALRVFFTDERIRTLVEQMLKEAQVMVESPIAGLPRIRGFAVQGKVDFASAGPLGVRIVDWKMGKSTGDDDSLQLFLYGKWALQHYRVDPENVVVQRVFLGDGQVEEERRLDAATLRRGEARLLEDVEWMEQLDRYGREGVVNAFSPCVKEKVCRQCKFQGICPAVGCRPVWKRIYDSSTAGGA